MRGQEGYSGGRPVLPAWAFREWPPGSTGAKPADLSPLEGWLKDRIAARGLQVRLCLYDYASDRWILLEAHRPFYPASMIKTLLLLTALEQVERGHLSLAETHQLAESDKFAGETPVSGTGILQYAGAGERYTFVELLYLMVSLSDNVATNIVFGRLGPERCISTAQRLGLKVSAFTRRMYDLKSVLPPNVATAFELTRMLLALQNREAAGEALTRMGIALMASTADRGRIGRFMGEGALVAGKVGTVSGVVGDMALIYFPERAPLALTIAVVNPPDQEEAAAFIGRLALQIVERLR